MSREFVKCESVLLTIDDSRLTKKLNNAPEGRSKQDFPCYSRFFSHRFDKKVQLKRARFALTFVGAITGHSYLEESPFYPFLNPTHCGHTTAMVFANSTSYPLGFVFTLFNSHALFFLSPVF